MQEHARVVIVGAGIVGCSLAYHLTQLGWRDIAVVEQGPLFDTGGSTSHAPGLVFQVNPSKTMAGFARYTADLWPRLTLDGEPCAKAVGSMEVAWTPERLEELKRRAGVAMSYGIEAHLVSAAEAREKVPMLTDRILGALYVPHDIQSRAIRPAEAMAREAEERGASFYGHTKVTGFDIAGGRITGVQTTRGSIGTDLVVAATGIWAPKVCGMAGVPIPLSPMQHLYAVTAPLPDLAGARGGDLAAVPAEPGQGDVLQAGGRELRDRLLPARAAAPGRRGDPGAWGRPAAAGGDAVRARPLRGCDGGGGRADAGPQGGGADPRAQRDVLVHHGRVPSAGRVAAGCGVLVGAGGLDHPRGRCRQGGGRVDRRGRAVGRPSGVRHQAVPPPRTLAAVREGAGGPAVPRGLRHHPSAPADGIPARPAAHAVPRAAEGAGGRVLRERGLGAAPVVRGQRRAARLPEREGRGAHRLGGPGVVADDCRGARRNP